MTKLFDLDELNKKYVKSINHQLRKTTLLIDLPGEIQTWLKQLYTDEHATSGLLATLINGIYTERKLTIFLSMPELTKLLANDKNCERRTMNDTEFKTFKRILIDNNAIEM